MECECHDDACSQKSYTSKVLYKVLGRVKGMWKQTCCCQLPGNAAPKKWCAMLSAQRALRPLLNLCHRGRWIISSARVWAPVGEKPEFCRRTFPRWGRSGPPVLGTGNPCQYWALAWRRTSRSSHPCATPWPAIGSEILSIRSEISLWKVAGLIWNRLVAPLSFGMINGIYGPSRMRMQEDACGQEHVVLQENTLLQDLEWEWRRNHVTLESSWPDLN